MNNIAIAYVNYEKRIEIDWNAVLVSAWNKSLEYEGDTFNKVYLNNKEFFKNSFDNAYDAAWAVSASGGKWRWRDRFVYVDSEGYIISFTHWDDDTSPIAIDKIDVSQLINGLGRWQKNKKYVNNIPRAIHDALKEV